MCYAFRKKDSEEKQMKKRLQIILVSLVSILPVLGFGIPASAAFQKTDNLPATSTFSVDLPYVGALVDNSIPAVKNLKATAVGYQSVQLSWNYVNGAKGYLIIGLNSKRPGKQIGYTASNRWVDNSASPTEFNYYWVIPYYKNSAGKIVVGRTSNYVYSFGTNLGQVVNVKTLAGKNGISLSWSSVKGANGYIVLSKQDSSKNGYRAKVSVTTTSFTDKNVQPGKTYFYWVYAVYKNSAGRILTAGKLSSYSWALAITEDASQSKTKDISNYLSMTVHQAGTALGWKRVKNYGGNALVLYNKNGLYMTDSTYIGTESYNQYYLGRWNAVIQSKGVKVFGLEVGMNYSDAKRILSRENVWKLINSGKFGDTYQNMMNSAGLLIGILPSGVVSKIQFFWNMNS